MSQAEFEAKWLHKNVRKRDGFWMVPPGTYHVTAALLEYYGNKDSVFAISGMGGQFTLTIAPEHLKYLDRDFEVLMCECCKNRKAEGSVGKLDDPHFSMWVCQDCYRNELKMRAVGE